MGTSNQKFLNYKDDRLQRLITDTGATDYDRQVAKNLLKYRLDYVNPKNVDPQLGRKTNDELVRMTTSPSGIEGTTEYQRTQAKKLLNYRRNQSAQAGTGTRTGTNTGTSTGTSTGTNTGTSTGTNTGTSTGTGTGTGTAATQYERPFGYEDINYTLKKGQTLFDFIKETEAQLDKIKKIPSHKRTRAQKALMQTVLPRILAKARYDLQESGNTDMAKKITTDAQLEQRMADLAGGLSTGVPQVTAVRPEVAQNELQGTGNVILGEGTTTATAQTPTQAMPTVPTGTEGVGQISGIERTAPSVTTMDTAQITPTGDYMQGVQGTVSPEAVATAQTEELDKRGTVQYQMTQLMSALEEGGEMPPWASPAVRKVGAVMQARGLGASSMASAAITQAVMESGIAIAAQDANKYSTIQLQNLNNKQQTALANAATYAAMDKANLSARLQSAVTNAQSLLSVDTANLTAQQQTNTLNFNALTQAMFKDAAEENARREFNAKNELQVQEFFAELGSQVETANANRTAAINQFNVGEANAMNQFNASMQDARDKFNSNMQYAIDQSNVNWRRQVNTADTAIQNETNRINVQNLFNMNQSALNALWQKYRDNAAWNFQKSESALQRQHEIGIMAMEFANAKETYTREQKDSIGIGVGNWLATWAAM